MPRSAHAQLYVSQLSNGNEPVGLALSGNNLLVANYLGTTVGEYDATTGIALNANFITGLNQPSIAINEQAVPDGD